MIESVLLPSEFLLEHNSFENGMLTGTVLLPSEFLLEHNQWASAAIRRRVLLLFEFLLEYYLRSIKENPLSKE